MARTLVPSSYRREHNKHPRIHAHVGATAHPLPSCFPPLLEPSKLQPYAQMHANPCTMTLIYRFPAPQCHSMLKWSATLTLDTDHEAQKLKSIQ
ncbi:hypothetical protein BDV06DRAFT_192584 [Aspergillus oleicola]